MLPSLKNLVILAATLGHAAVGVAAAPAFDPATSPFADRPADSFSNYKDENGKLVEPLWGSHADRNAIMLVGAGRVWSAPGYASFATSENSEVCVDGHTQSEGSPGRMIDFVDGPLASFAVGDASYAWDWKWRGYDDPKGQMLTADEAREGKVPWPNGWEPERHTVNDFAFTKLDFPYLNVPTALNPHWLQPVGAVRPELRQADYPVQRAVRTAGLVRGKTPYVLVVDDIQKDSAPHHYDWTLSVEPDIQIATVENHGKNEVDVYLTGGDPQQKQPAPKTPLPPTTAESPAAGQPMLLVRVLNGFSGKALEPTIVDLPNVREPKKYGPVRRLVIGADSVSPDFEVLLYPFRQGQPVPTTAWDARREAVTLKIADSPADTLRFLPGPTGRTGVTIERGGNAILKLSIAYSALADK